MSFALTEDYKKKLRDECMEEAYKYFKLTKTISDNRFYFYLSSQNLRGYGADDDKNGLEFIFPNEVNNHILDARIKVLDCSLPPILNAENRLDHKWYIHMTGGILKKRTFIPAGNGLANGNDYYHGDILASGIVEEITSKSKTKPFVSGTTADDDADDKNVVIIFKDGQTRNDKAEITAKIAGAGAGDEVVGGYEASEIAGRKMLLDNEWRACNNPAGKTAKIVFGKDNATINGPYDLTRGADDFVKNWNMTLCLELLPDFMRNDKIMY